MRKEHENHKGMFWTFLTAPKRQQHKTEEIEEQRWQNFVSAIQLAKKV